MADNSKRLQKIFAAREFLFGDNRPANTTKLFAKIQSVNDSLEVLGLSNFFKVLNFIQVALVNFYRTSNLAAQMKILPELDADYNAYQNIFPAVADALIQTVDRARADKKTCLEIFYHRLGDPRFGDDRFKWYGVSDTSREIFCHWLSENDLETFFNIVAATSNDAQWSYREKFWRRYLPRISNTWIFLTGNAQRYAAQSKVNHGILTNGDGNQAVFVFQIGRYIFSEWSNVGKVRAHDSGWREVLFGRRDINGDFIRKNSVKDRIHSSPKTNFWQREVSDWIEANC